MRKILIFFGFIIGCEVSEVKRSGESREGRPDAESWDAIITLTNQGIKRAVIRAGHLEKYNERQYILLNEKVDADFFNDEEVYTTNLKSQIAEIDEEEDFLIAIGDVIVLSDSGVTLFTDTLSWDNHREKVYTDDNGFRVPNKNFKYSLDKPSIFFIGDSTTLGNGIKEEKTFVGKLRIKKNDFDVYNSSVIGYQFFHHEKNLNLII